MCIDIDRLTTWLSWLQQYEHSNASVSMAEKWLPKIKQVFRVVSYTQCMNISNPYWEEGFVYPTDDVKEQCCSHAHSIASFPPPPPYP